MVAEPYIVVSQSKNLLRAVCLLPRALVGRLYKEKESILGIQLKWPSQIEASYFGGYFTCPQKCAPLLLPSLVGSCQYLHHLHLHVLHKKLLRRKWHQS